MPDPDTVEDFLKALFSVKPENPSSFLPPAGTLHSPLIQGRAQGILGRIFTPPMYANVQNVPLRIKSDDTMRTPNGLSAYAYFDRNGVYAPPDFLSDPDSTGWLEGPTLAHEYTHALQDRVPSLFEEDIGPIIESLAWGPQKYSAVHDMARLLHTSPDDPYYSIPNEQWAFMAGAAVGDEFLPQVMRGPFGRFLAEKQQPLPQSFAPNVPWRTADDLWARTYVPPGYENRNLSDVSPLQQSLGSLPAEEIYGFDVPPLNANYPEDAAREIVMNIPEDVLYGTASKSRFDINPVDPNYGLREEYLNVPPGYVNRDLTNVQPNYEY